jgi:hypothetical protein
VPQWFELLIDMAWASSLPACVILPWLIASTSDGNSASISTLRPRASAAGRQMLDRLLNLKLICPECFVAIRIEPKSVPSLIDRFFGIILSVAEKAGSLIVIPCA